MSTRPKTTFKVTVSLRDDEYPETYYIETDDRAEAEIKATQMYRAKLEIQVTANKIEIVK